MAARVSKKEKQLDNKRQHLAARSLQKRDRKREHEQPQSFERNPPTRFEKDSFLIVCEGKNTEVDYFNFFKLKSARIKAVGEGYNTISLVKRTLKIVNEEKSKGRYYDQVWCVFDKDDFNDFNEAIIKAQGYGFNVAYSNQAFEYWLLLHFNDHQGGRINRKYYEKMLNIHLKPLGLEYDGSGKKKIEDVFFEILQSKEKSSDRKTRQDKAITRAENIYNRLSHDSPALEESSTKVFLLVKEILKNLL